MPLRLNLYHELQLQKKQKAYDPLKISVLVMVVAACIMAVYYFSILRVTMAAKDLLQSSSDEYKKLEVEEKAAKEKEVELITQKTNSEILEKRMEGRFYWPQLLEDIASCATPKIQIQKLSAESAGETGRVVVGLEGLVASLEPPRRSAEEFRTALISKFSSKYSRVAASFRKLDDSVETISFNGQNLKAVNYTINLEFFLSEANVKK